MAKPEFKCIFKCAFEHEGLFKNSEVDSEKLVQVLISETDLDQNGKEIAIKKVPECLHKSRQVTDLCEKSFGIFECVFDM